MRMTEKIICFTTMIYLYVPSDSGNSILYNRSPPVVVVVAVVFIVVTVVVEFVL